ncbi:MAG: HAD-IIIA family hydrolase [Proteobacteria bacterium]|nr:HAD-IIIA family hydrolase [Pseudomonadota bacterium]
MKEIDENLREKIKRVKLLILDVDGILTDGSINYTDDGREFKSFDVKDGHGIKLLMRGGIDVALITARESNVVAIRAKDLGITDVFQGKKEKLSTFEDIVANKGLEVESVAYIGDDLIDLPVLRRVGLSASVSDAVSEVKEVVDYVTDKPGGRGAVRELTDMILKVQGLWQELTERYNK